MGLAHSELVPPTQTETSIAAYRAMPARSGEILDIKVINNEEPGVARQD